MHVCKGTPSAHATKIWLTRNGGCIVANNNANIPSSTLRELLDIIAAQHSLICRKWKEFLSYLKLSFIANLRLH